MPANDELVRFVCERLEERIGRESIADLDADLFELGLDSIDAVELTGDIETRFDLAIDPTLPFEHRSINALIRAVLESAAGDPASG